LSIMINQLLPDIDSKGFPELEVHGITDDSRKVEPGDLFIAVPGINSDGRDYIQTVAEKSAGLVLCEPPAPDVFVDIPVVEFRDLKSNIGRIASRYFGDPSSQMLVVAITGTNGKTSCSHFISEALSTLGQKCGTVGTMGYGTVGHLTDAGLTTPDAINLQKYLAALQEDSCKAVSIEASSHGLEQHRLNGTTIDVAVFTNITRDHLDYHNSFDEYKRSKQALFQWPELKTAIVNIDDEFGLELCSVISKKVEVLTTSTLIGIADVTSSDVHLDNSGMEFKLISPWGEGTVKSPLMGRFNISNMLSTTALLGSQGFPFPEIVKTLSGLGVVRGRMDVIREEGCPTILIDYAHTPDALDKALQAAREHCEGELWCVFGCGGDRDKGKRRQMGEIASRVADHTMITDDNPRSESSSVITGEILKGAAVKKDVQVVTDRRSAILKVLGEASNKDTVLIAGKGHEEYQEINGKKYSFSDYKVVEDFVSQMR
jgi:UDP-N-acetylmuramoyl-L-alanyl-D-glutamate--2,6-diaminopimelate ligase